MITVNTNLDLNTLLLGYDFGTIDNSGATVLQLALSGANIDFGTISNPGNFAVDLGEI